MKIKEPAIINETVRVKRLGPNIKGSGEALIQINIEYMFLWLLHVSAALHFSVDTLLEHYRFL